MTKPSTTGTTPNRTPARNNYAAPHTPIASAKRPRSSIDKNNNCTMLSPNGGQRLPPSAPLDEENVVLDDTVPQTPCSTRTSLSSTTRESAEETQFSPMHKAKPLVIHEEPHVEDGEEGTGESASWVGRKVDALFSPVLNFLSGKEGEEEFVEDGRSEKPVEEEDDDDDAIKPPGSDTTSDMTSQETEEEEDDEQPGEDAAALLAERRVHQVENAEDDDDVLVEDDHSSQGSDEEEEDEFNPYAFIKSLPNYELVAPLRPPIALDPKEKDAPPITLVLDLDETLVHCTVEPVDDANLVFPVVFHGMTYQVHVRLRPHLFDFLDKIAGKFEVVVFTASQKVYANELLDLIDPEKKYIQHRLFRESCLSVEGNFLKDLNVLGRDLSKTILVDNSPHAFGYQVDNGIPIESWFDDPSDNELLKLERFLKSVQGVKDVRLPIRKTFRTYQLVDES